MIAVRVAVSVDRWSEYLHASFPTTRNATRAKARHESRESITTRNITDLEQLPHHFHQAIHPPKDFPVKVVWDAVPAGREFAANSAWYNIEIVLIYAMSMELPIQPRNTSK